MHDIASVLYNEFLGKYFDKWYDLPDAKKEEMGFEFMPIGLKLKRYDYEEWYKKRPNDEEE